MRIYNITDVHPKQYITYIVGNVRIIRIVVKVIKRTNGKVSVSCSKEYKNLRNYDYPNAIETVIVFKEQLNNFEVYTSISDIKEAYPEEFL